MGTDALASIPVPMTGDGPRTKLILHAYINYGILKPSRERIVAARYNDWLEARDTSNP